LFPFLGTPYQRPGLLGVPKKEKSNYDYPPLLGAAKTYLRLRYS
jgi:hypothetical protein